MKTCGVNFVRPPDAGPVFRGIMGITGIRRAPRAFRTYTQSTFLYTDSATSIRLGRAKVFTPIPCPGAVFIPWMTPYALDTRRMDRSGWHRWIHIEFIEDTPTPLPGNTATTGGYFEDPDGHLGRLFQEALAAAAPADAATYWKIQAIGTRILALASRACQCGPKRFRINVSRHSAAAEHLVQRTVAVLAARLHERHTITTIAAALQVSPSTLAHTYRATAGETPMQTLRAMRLSQARRLLATGCSHEAIAEACGYYDGRHFAREFRKAEGLSPQHFLARLFAPGHATGSTPP